MAEIWKGIQGYEGYYQCSSHGRIKSSDRHVNKKLFGSKRKVTGKIETPFICTRSGYFRIRLSKEGVNRKYFVHRLIAVTFISNPENKPTVNHKNGIKTDNVLSNLEWATQSENIRHAVDVLGVKLGEHFRGENWQKKNNLPTPGKKKVEMLDKNGILLNTYTSAWEAEEANGITHGLVSQYCHGKRNNKKYNFKYIC